MSRSEEIDMNIEDYVPEDLSLDNRFRTQSFTSTPSYQPFKSAAPIQSTTVALNPDELGQGPSEQDTQIKGASTADRQEPAVDNAKKKKKKEKEARAAIARDVTPRMPSLLRFFTDTRTKSFLGFALILISVFVLISVVSFFRTGAADQSQVINNSLATMGEQGKVENSLGAFGAILSYVLLTDTLGLGSLVLIPYLWVLALGLLGLRKCNFWSATFKALLCAVTISMVLGLVTFNAGTAVYWGGLHGHYINAFLIAKGTWLTAMIVSVLLVGAVCCVYLNELKLAWDKWQAMNASRKMREELRRQRQRELETLDADLDSDTPDAATASTVDNTVAVNSENDNIASAAADLIDDSISVQPAVGERKTEAESASSISSEGTSAKVHDIAVKPVEDVLIIDSVDSTHGDVGKKTSDPQAIDITVSAPEIEVAETISNPADDGLYDHRAELSHYRFPDISLLEDRPSGPVVDMEEQQANKDRIVQTLLHYGIPISKIDATVGPTVTLYEVVPAEGVRIAQIKRLEDDIALSLAALGIRIIAPIPGKGTVGIEVPNKDPKTVSMRSIITSKKYQECKMALPMAMGATISNEIFIADLAKMPHLLVAGATGMGKSVGLNAILASLLYKKHPSELKFVLIDPKMVEFSLYSKLERHYLAKLPMEDNAIITDMDKVLQTLNSLCVEMDQRYELLRDANVRALEEYNKKFTERRLNPEKGHRYLPYIVVVVDEFADIIMTKGKEVETPIARIAQKARAVGIHMILATQRPSTNVITGLIKANFPGRIAFRVIQMVDSRTILDCPGANQLIGRGDMLFSHNGNMQRVQCAFISTEEVEALTEFVDSQVGYEHAYYLPEVPLGDEGGPIAGASTDRDALFDEAARFVVSKQMGSTSSLQRQFGIGYNRAGKLMDQMEAAGIVGPVNGSKPRAILVDSYGLEMMLNPAQ